MHNYKLKVALIGHDGKNRSREINYQNDEYRPVSQDLIDQIIGVHLFSLTEDGSEVNYTDTKLEYLGEQ